MKRPTPTSLLFFFQCVLLALWIFTIPTNLFWKMLPNFGFVGGLQIDYLIPKLYLSDLVSIGLICVWVLEQLFKKEAGIFSKALNFARTFQFKEHKAFSLF